MWYMLKDYAASISLQGQEEESLEICCSGTISSGQSRSRSIRGKSCSQGMRMEYSHSSLSGMMSRLLEPITRNASSISKDLEVSETGSSLQEDSPVRTSASQEREQDLKEIVLDYGVRCVASLARWDRNTCSWRTPQCSLFEDLTESLETLPKWGMTVGGELWELTMQELRTEETDSGCCANGRTRHIPTQTCSDVKARNKRTCTTDENFRGISLDFLVEKEPYRMWPTPLSRDWKGSTGPEGLIRKDGKCRLDSLPNAVAYFPTPCVHGLSGGTGNVEKADKLYKDGIISVEERRSFRAGNGGKLNPDWEEWLMGWPIGWTSLKPLARELFDSWLATSPIGWWSIDHADTGEIPRVTEENDARKNRIIAIGNGQVPASIKLFMEIINDCIF